MYRRCTQYTYTILYIRLLFMYRWATVSGQALKTSLSTSWNANWTTSHVYNDDDNDDEDDGDDDVQRVHTAKFLCSHHYRPVSDNKLYYYTNLVLPVHLDRTAAVVPLCNPKTLSMSHMLSIVNRYKTYIFIRWYTRNCIIEYRM